MIAAVAFRLAFSSDPEHRWRRITIPLTSCLATVAILIGLGSVQALSRERARDNARAALLSPKPSASDLYVVGRDDSWRGEQFSVIWIEPATSTRPQLLPGLEVPLLPGWAAVSPALDALAQNDPDINARYRQRVVLQRDGLANPSELIAYIRPKTKHTIRHADQALRITGFGHKKGLASFPLSIQSETNHPILVITASVLILLGIPAALLTFLGSSTASVARERRLSLLYALGAPRRKIATIAALESLVFTLPASLITIIIGLISLPNFTVIPLTGHRVFDGDMAIFPAVGFAVVFFVCCISSTASIASALQTKKQYEQTPRPTTDCSSYLHPARALPEAIAAALFIIGVIQGGKPGVSIILFAFATALIGLPLVLPGILRPIGSLLAYTSSLPALFAGKRLSWRPERFARPFSAYALLLAIALAVSGYVTVMRSELKSEIAMAQNRAVGSEYNAALIRWLDPEPSDLQALRLRLHPAVVATFTQTKATTTLYTACSSSICLNPPDHRLKRKVVQALTEVFGSDTRFRLNGSYRKNEGKTGAGNDYPTEAVVIANKPLAKLETEVRVASMQTLVAPTVVTASTFISREPPAIELLVAGFVVSAILLFIAFTVSSIDRSIAARQSRTLLHTIGAPHSVTRQVESLQFAISFFSATCGGAAVGLVMCLVMRELVEQMWNAPFPLSASLLFLGLAIVLGVFGSAAVALLPAGTEAQTTISSERESRRMCL